MSDDFDDLPLFAPQESRRSKLERQFWKFHADNPHVYQLLVGFAREWKKAGRAHLGIAMLFERTRWQVLITIHSKDFKLNNNHRAFYSRLIMENEPDLADLFSLRRQKIQSTIGPSNDDLPPGEHIA